jgi:hypothetical protein
MRHTCSPVLPALLLSLAFAVGPAGAAEDRGWPRTIDVPEARILIYQPQPDERQDNILTGRAAVSVTPKGKTEPVFGTIWLRCRMEIDREKRTVDLIDVTVPRARFPGSTPEMEQKLAAIVEKEVPKWDLTVSLDRLVASLRAVEQEKAYAENFNTQPPRIVYEPSPALLVLIDGEPVMRPVEGSELQRIVNTPYFLVFDGKEYYLSGGAAWFSTSDLKGEWKTTKKPPKDVAEYYSKTQGQTSGKPSQKEPGKEDKAKPPKIVVATEPTELISSKGEPKYAPITGTDLIYMTNTERDVFMDVAGQQYYVLLSGRWFRSKSLATGPWEFVRADALPGEFRKIPEPSAKGEVLASVAGTPQAEEALLDAQVPQTAAIKRGEAKTKVEYDGKPKFEEIEGTKVEYAVNTTSQVLKVKGKYYVCDQAVWFAGDSPQGPWTVAEKVPQEIQEIPPSAPVYNTKYVHVYDSTPEVVYVGYMPGYVGCYPYYGTVVWGTGWYYPPYVSPYVYYPRPVTWGFSVHYNPYSGWSFGIGFSSGPFHFTFWGGGAYGGYWGPVYGGYPPPVHISGSPGGIGGVGGVGGPGGAGSPRPTPYPGTNGNIYNRGENKGRNTATQDKKSRPASQPAAKTANNVYADRDGNVHRRGSDGSWQTREGNSWKGSGGAGDKAAGGRTEGGRQPSTMDRPGGGSRGSGLEKDYQARQRGSQRTQSFQSGGGMGRGGGGARPRGGPRR